MGCSAVLVDALRDAERNCTGDSRQGLQTTWWEPSEERPGHGEPSQVRSTTGEAMRTIARYAADPENAESFANLRVSLFDYALEMPMDQLASEADKLNPEELVDIVISTVRSILDDPEFISRTEERIAQVLEEAGDGTLRAWLDEVGLTEVWTQSTTELIADRLTAVVNTDAFEAWWVELFA